MKTRGSVCTGSCFTGLVIALVLLLARQPIHAQTYGEKVLYNFTGADGDGAVPEANLLLIGSNLYGTTFYGGASSYGNVFMVNKKTGEESVLYNFNGSPSDGENPNSNLIKDSNGDLYSTTSYGGASSYGTVFMVNKKTGKESVLYNFNGSPSDGANPGTLGGLVIDSAGNFYGTTTGGGVSGCDVNGFWGCGTIFKVSPTGGETVLYSFCSESGCKDGANPIAGLIMDDKGNLYGTTFYGGAFSAGTIFKVDPATGIEAVLYNFTGGSDGAGPVGPLIMDSAGNLYGTALHGGLISSVCASNDYVGCGTVFELAASGKQTVLYGFCSQTNCTDGANPNTSLIKDSKGNFYSTTFYGGASGVGTVFVVNKKTLKETVIHSFTGSTSDGANPHGSLIRDASGNLFGTTMYGGTYGAGTVFQLIP
jgi:uncharacterized repeat protein (TIGR03803 family)